MVAGRGNHRIWSFGDFQLDVDRGSLLSGDRDIRLRPQSFAVLSYLVEHHGVLVTKQELLDKIWGKKAVTDDSLTHCLIDIRKALGDDAHRKIRTIPRRGFIFEIDVEEPGTRNSVQATTMLRWGLVAGIPIVIAAFAMSYGEFQKSSINPLSRAQESADPRPADGAGPQSAATVSAIPKPDNSRSLDTSAAHESYLQGKFMFDRRGPGDLVRAEKYFRNATDADRKFAPAWAGLAGVYGVQLNQGKIDSESGFIKLREAAETAVLLDPELPEGRLRLAQAHYMAGDRDLAERIHKQVLRDHPNNALALGFAAGRAGNRGNMDKAIELQRRVTSIEPLNSVNHNNLAAYLSADGRYAEAIDSNRVTQHLSPGDPMEVGERMAQLYILQGRYFDALRIIRQCPESSAKDQGLALVYRAIGRAGEAERALNRLNESNGPDARMRAAEVYAHYGDHDASFRQLEIMENEFEATGNTFLKDEYVVRIRFSPFLRPLRSDERWTFWSVDG